MKPQVLVSRFPSFFRTLFFGGLPALALLLAAGTASGQILDWVNQPFSQAFIGGTDQGYAVAYDASGNVYVTGSFAGTADFDPGPGTANLTSAGGDDIFVAKYDASGNYIWANRIGGTGGDIGYGLAVDGSGNVHVTGYFSGSNVDFDPGPGTENLSSAGGIDIFFAKYDASGNYVWANRVGGTSGEQGRGIAVDGIGNVHLTGSFRGNNVDFDPGPGIVNLSSNSFTTDIFIAKYDASGNYVWANRVGSSNGLSDVGYGLALDVSGNVHVTGHFTGTADFDPGAGTANLTSAGNIDIFIAKYDASGNYVWANRVGGSGSDTGNSLAVDGSGNVHLTGFFQATVDFDPGAGPANLTSIGNVDIFIAKYNASGNYVWAKQVGNTGVNYGNGLALDGSGNVHVTGQFQGTNVDFDPGGGTANLSSAGSDDIFIAKYNASGNYVWAKRIGGTINDQGLGLAVDGSGNVHVTGSFRGTDVDFDPGAGTAELSAGAGNSDAFALRLSAAGNYDWAVNWGQYNNTAPTPTLMECRAIARDASGNVYATGSFQGLYVDFDPGAGTAYLTSAGGSDIFIAKYDASGNYVWAKRIGGTSTDIGYGLAVDAGGNVHVTGQFSGSNIDFDPGAGTALLSSSAVDLFVAKYDASGNYVWAKRIGGTSTDIGYGLAVDGSGNIYVTGIFLGSNVDFDPGIGTAPLSSAGGADIFIAKYDASGGYLWANRVGSTGADNGYGLAVDGSGNVHVTGGFRGMNVDFDPSASTANLSSAGNNDIFIAKYDASGNYMWANRVGSTSDDIGYGIAVDGSGNVHVTGYFQATNVDFDPGPNTENLSSAGSADIFIAKYDASGNYVWAKRVGNTSGDQGLGLALDGSGNVHVTGFFNTTNVDFDPGAGTATLASAGGNDIFIAKYDASGNYVEAMQAGSTGSDAGYCIAAGAAGKVAAGGRFDETVDFDPGVGTSDRTAVATSGDIFIAQYTFTATAPEINLKGNSLSIADGDVTPDVADHTDFENACVNSGTVVRTFTIENTGTADLTIPAAGITLSGANMADFTVGGISLPATITGGNATIFTVTFDPSAAGLRSATVNIANDDSDENPYDFAIQGTGVADPTCNISSGPTSVCPNSTGHIYAATGGGTYLWSISGNGLINGSNTGSSVTVNASAAGTYTLTVEVTDNGCTSTCSQMVDVEDVTQPSITCPANVTVNNDAGQCNAAVTVAQPTFSDNCSVSFTPDLSNISNTNTLTIEAWVKPDGQQSPATGMVFNRSSPSGACGLNFAWNSGNPNNKIGYHWAGSGGTWGWTGGPTYLPNEWNHIALVIEPAKATIYVTNSNGTSSAVNTFTHNPVNLNSLWNVGDDTCCPNREFDGTIDEVRIWNKSRSQAEILSTMNAELAGNEADLVLYYNFNQGIAGGNNAGITTLNDLTGSVNGDLQNVDLTGTASNWVAGQAGFGNALQLDGSDDRVPFNTMTTVNFPTIENDVNNTDNASGTYAVGTATVTWMATDASGLTNTCQQTVTVIDNQPPAVSCPANQNVPPTTASPCSAPVAGIDAVSSDNCGAPALTYALSGATTGSGNGQASGLTFNAGVTTVTYTATDGAGLQSSCMFTVTVQACLEIQRNHPLVD
ncbi:MAG: SBBP repeat-containing protein [Saprospiraceae bacterium]